MNILVYAGYALMLIGFYLIVSLCGLVVMSLAARKRFGLFEAFLTPMVGLSSLGLQLWLYGLVDVPWTRLTLLLPWLIASFLLRGRLKYCITLVHKEAKSWYSRRKELERLSILAIVATIIVVAIYALHTIGQANTSADFLAMWGYKAKEFYALQSVGVNEYVRSSQAVSNYFHVDYPPLYPLMADSLYVLKGGVSELLMRSIPYMLWLTSCLSILAFSVKRLTLQNATLLTATLALSPVYFLVLMNGQYLGFADLPLAAFMLVSAIYLIRSLGRDAQRYLYLSVAFASGAALIKNEGLPFLIAIIGLGFISHWRMFTRLRGAMNILKFGGFIFVCALPLITWEYYKYQNSIGSEFSLSNLDNADRQGIERVSYIFKLSNDYLMSNEVYIWQIMTTVIAMVYAVFQRNKEAVILSIIIGAMFAAYFVSYYLSPHNLVWHINASLDRLLSQLLPITVLLLTTVIAFYHKAIKHKQHR